MIGNSSISNTEKFARKIIVGDEAVEVDFSEASQDDVDKAVIKAQEAFMQYRLFSGKQKASFLVKIAEGIEAAKVELVALAKQESHLPEARLERGSGKNSKSNKVVRSTANKWLMGKCYYRYCST